jgi:hypothetical protein
MLAWLAGLRKGRVIRLNWHEGCLRIDSEVYFPPKKPAEVKITLEKQSLRVVTPPNSS